MKVYLASRYSRFPEMQKYRTELVAIGHTVTSRWIDGDHQIDDGQTIKSPDDEKQRFAREDLEDLSRAQLVIAFTEEPGCNHKTRGGRHVEFGYALAQNKQLIVVGYRENVFYWLSNVLFFNTWNSALAYIQDWYAP